MAPKPKKQKKKQPLENDECGTMTEILMLLSPSDNENNSSSSDDDEDQENVSPSTSRRRDDASEPEDNDDKKDKDYRPGKRTPKRKLPNRSRGMWLAPSEPSSNLARLFTPMPRVPLQTINPNIDLNNNVVRATTSTAPQTSEPSRSDEIIEDEIPIKLYAKESFYRDCANGVVQREFNLLSDLINNYSYEEYDRETRKCLKESAEQAKDSIRNGEYFFLGKHVLEFRYAGELDPSEHSIHLYASNNTDRYLRNLVFYNFLIINRDHTESELVDLSQDDLTMALMSLVYKKRLGVVAERFECDNELKVGHLHLDVYLNEGVKANFTTSSADPSENMRFQMAEEMHLVMANVCLSHASHKNYCKYFFKNFLKIGFL